MSTGVKKLEVLRRVTTSGKYLPEIDGLRFVAIFLVLLSHISTFVKQSDIASFHPNYLEGVLFNGVWGVSLFFIISGYVIGLQFTRENKLSGQQLKKYYLRRFTRLEFPYFIALLIFFFLYVVVIKKYTFTQLLPHFIASIFYSHDIIYGGHSLVLSLAWSLEVEIQFYIIAPLLSLLIFIKSKWLDIIFLLLCFSAYPLFYKSYHAIYILFSFGNLLFGMLVAKYSSMNSFLINNYLFNSVFGMAAMAGFLLIPYAVTLSLILIKQSLLFAFFFFSLQPGMLKKILSVNLFTLIGGMCYSIYLVHYIPLISVGNVLMGYFNTHNYYKNLLMGLLVLTPVMIICSSLFYLLIEKPCMQRDWYKKFFFKRETGKVVI